MSQAGRFISGGPSPGSAIEFITPNTGGPIPPTAGNVTLVTANSTVIFAGNAGTSTITQDFGLSNLILGTNPAGITIAAQNVGVGDLVLPALTTGLSNTAVGYLSANALTQGNSNTLIGFSAGELITTGDENTAVGAGALAAVTTNSSNTAVGFESLNVATGTNNTAVGASSGILITSGSGNTALGQGALSSLTTSNANVAIGLGALLQSVTGINNIALGANAGALLTTNDSNNIIIGAPGAGGINNTLIIGSPGSGAQQVDRAFIAGIANVALASGAQTVVIDPVTSQLGVGNGSVNEWIDVIVNQPLLTNTGHVIDGAGTITLSLPVTANFGDVIRIASFTRQWIVTQGVGQQIFFGFRQSTLGVGGSINSTNVGDCVEMVCVVANTAWAVISSIGNITVT